MEQFTEQQAKDFYKSKVWKSWTLEQIVNLQLYQDRLCVPFNLFHKAIEKVLERPVWTHEFAFPDKLRLEFEGIWAKPTLQEIMDLIPEEKRIIIVAPKKD